MPKEKRSVEDLDAELAALEAELAALEGRAPPPRKAPAKPAPRAEPEPAPAEARPEEAPEEAAPRKRFALPKAKLSAPRLPKAKLNLPFGKKKEKDAEAREEDAAPSGPATEALVDAGSDAPPALAQAPAVAVVEEEPPKPAEVIPVTDGSRWRREDGAWVRVNPDVPVPVVRRVLDENGEVVREEAATQADVDEATGRKPERGLGKLLGGRPLKLPGLPKFGRKGE